MVARNNLLHKSLRTLLAVASLTLAAGIARAQTAMTAGNQSQNTSSPTGGASTPKPWTVGVSQEQQKHAETLYQEGNRDFTSGFFVAAVAKYQAALQHWNHPGIHYNLALAMISLDRPVEAYESIIAALAHGTDGLHPDEHQRATDYRRVLRQRIAEVEILCDEPGAAVTLDGKPLFTGPGRLTTIVLPGKHQVIASKSGHLATIKIFKVAAAAHARLELRLLAENRNTVPVRRWPAWTPWAVTGLGVGTGAAAAALHWQSGVNTRRLNELAPIYCAQGCPVYPPVLLDLRDRASWQRNAAYIGYATTAALLATGALLAYLDHRQVIENRAAHDLARISLYPGGPEGSPGVSSHIPF